MSLTSKYIEDQYIPNLKVYKYEGADNSLLYIYFIGPSCSYISEHLPNWLPPNVITTTGWLLNLTNLFLTTYYGGLKGCDYFPPWVCYLAAVNYSVYIYLDSLDGKQARRIKASTPLGVLFDHGSDACTCFFITLVAGSFFYFNNIYQYLLIFLPLSITFFLNFIEEYYTGVLDLPVINGVEEGCLYVFTIFFLSGYYGSSFYNKTFKIFSYDLKLSEINGIIVFFGAILHCLKCIYDINQKIDKKKVGEMFKNCLIFVLFTISLLSVVFLSDSIVVREYPKLLISSFGLQIAKIFSTLQLCQVLGCKVNYYRPVFIIPLVTLLSHSIIYYFLKVQFIFSIDVLIIISLIWNFLSWAHYVIFCSEEICEILNINRFNLRKRYSSRPSFGENQKLN
jgi:ethanolaminephosphotransferase